MPDGVPLFVYPGDLEVSIGAESVAEAVPPLLEQLPDAHVVFAYRAKTPAAPLIAEAWQRRLPEKNVRFAGKLPDLLALLSGATAVLFPVDELTGKVDLPISLLEAMQLGIPVVALDYGPLADLEGAAKVARRDTDALVREAVRLATEPAYREQLVRAGHRAVSERYEASVVASAYERVWHELWGRA